MALLDRMPALAVFTSAKSFDVPGVGHPLANRLGLHPLRIRAADAATGLRRLLVGGRRSDPALNALREAGVAVISDFLPAERFDRLQAEARARMVAVARRVPRREGRRPGFQPQEPFDGGFDRHDGSTLNRFVAIDAERTPEAHAFVRWSPLAKLSERAATIRYRPEKLWLYEMTYGTDVTVGDPQQMMHRDTFHSVTKLWFFLEDVVGEDGFVYCRGSHRQTRARLRWEYERSVLGSTTAPSRGGAFRVGEDELQAMGVAAPESFPVRANTLVIADTRGFHRRGDAEPGARRLAIYGSLRPSPFVPVPY